MSDYRKERKGKPANRGKRISPAAFRRMWFDQDLSLRDIGEALGISKCTVSQRARTLGLPSRYDAIVVCRPFRRIHNPDLCKQMLAFGVSIAEICSHFGITDNTLRSFRERHGLPGRKRGKCPENSKTVAQFMVARAEIELAARMAASAAETRAAMGAQAEACRA